MPTSSTSRGAQEFFAEQANIRLAIGGFYEIQFDPKRAVGDQGLLLLTAIDTTFLLRRVGTDLPEFTEIASTPTALTNLRKAKFAVIHCVSLLACRYAFGQV